MEGGSIEKSSICESQHSLTITASMFIQGSNVSSGSSKPAQSEAPHNLSKEDMEPICKHARGDKKLYYCSCKKFICRFCPCFNIPNHHILIEDKAKELILKIQEKKPYYKSSKEANNLEIINKYLEELEKVKSQRAERKNKILERITTLLAKDEEKFNKAADDLLDHLSAIQDEIKRKQEDMDFQMKQIDDIIADLEKAIDNTTIKDIILANQFEIEKSFEIMRMEKEKTNINPYKEPFKTLCNYDGYLESLIKFEEQIQKNSSSFSSLFSVVPMTSQVIEFDANKLKGKKRIVENFKFPLFSGTIFKHPFIYCAGGTNNFVDHLAETAEISIDNFTKKELPNLNFQRSENSLVNLRSNLICVGGRNGSKQVPQIEILDLYQRKKWEVIENAEFSGCYCSVSSCEIHFQVYIFGGIADHKVLNELYVLCLPNRNFVKLGLKTYQEFPHLHSAALVCNQCKDSEKECDLLIIGGGTSPINKSEVTNQVTLYKNETLDKCNELLFGDSFYGSCPNIQGTELLLIGANYWHQYGNNNKCIPSNKWLPI